jgi:NTP pyrophosphatase (non-canonical NTP hydrolase)
MHRDDAVPSSEESDALNFSGCAERLREFTAARSWEQFHDPKNLSMALAAEVGELLEIFQWLTPEQARTVRDSKEDLDLVRDELADILIYVFRMADVLGIHLSQSVDQKITRNEERYPVDVSRGSALKYSRREQ